LTLCLSYPSLDVPTISRYTVAVRDKPVLHPLRGSKRAGELARVVEELYRSRRAVVIWVADEHRRQMLDEYLWTFRKLSFVAHALHHPPHDASDEPVVLVAEPVNPNHATVLVIGDELPPSDWAAQFEEIHDFVSPDPSGEERSQWWEEWQRQAP